MVFKRSLFLGCGRFRTAFSLKKGSKRKWRKSNGKNKRKRAFSL
jgi:hypothetical protein